MTLQLFVPALSTRLLADIELRLAKVRKWLDELPMLNVAEAGRQLFSTLSIYNRIHIDIRRRLELLELYRRPVMLICQELEKQYLGLPLPLIDRHKSAAEQNRQFHLEMAFGYKRLVLEAESDLDTLRTQERLADTALAVQRAIRHLSEALAVTYKTYAPCPIGVWREIHALYGFAERLAVTERALADPLNTTLPHSSVSHAYKQALLLDLSDPYHLPAYMTGKIHRYLDRYAGLALLLPASRTFDPTCQFLIDQDSDRAGVLYVDAELAQPERFRLLNTVELARTVHAQLTALQHGEALHVDGLEEDFFRENSQDLLVRLIQAWGVHPQRVFRRLPRPDAEIELAVGIDAINYWINGGRKFVISSTFVGPMPQRTLVGPNEHKTLDIKVPELGYTVWKVRDESAGGLSLAKSGHIKKRLRVGDLVALRAAGVERTWHIGVVRWVKSANPSAIEIGVQRLAPTAEPVAIKTISDEGKESDFLPALILPEVASLKQKATLVTHRGVYRPNRTIYLDDGARLRRVTIADPMEFTSSYERFQFRPQHL